jgi:hypothetical protein
MELRKHIGTLILLATAATMSWAQAESGQMADSQALGYGLTASDRDAQATTADSLPGMDQGKTPIPSDRRSFFLAGLHIGENAEGVPGSSSQISSVTSAFGSLHLLSLRRRSETAIDYLGGAEVSNNSSFLGSSGIQVQQLNAEQHFLWRRRELTFLDNLGDLPGGDFGSTWFGGAGLYSLNSAGVNANQPAPANLSSFFGSSDFAGFGGSHISNLSLAEYTQALTSRSSFTVIGGYGMTAYPRNEGLTSSHAVGAQVSYAYKLSGRDHIGFLYGFRSLRFPEAGEGTINTNVGELTYGRQISPRMSFTLGVGPEFVKLDSPLNGSAKQVNLSGNVSVGYLLRKAKLTLGCNHVVTNGSGLFVGANTDICQFSVALRTHDWSIALNPGYARLSPIGQISVANPAPAYQYAFVGVAVNRQLGQHVGAFASYQFNNQSFGNSLCSSGPCSQIAQHVLSVGIDLRDRPRRLE